MKKTRKKGTGRISDTPVKRSVVIGTDVDADGFVTVTVTGPAGTLRYRVPVEPLQVPHGPVGEVAGVA